MKRVIVAGPIADQASKKTKGIINKIANKFMKSIADELAKSGFKSKKNFEPIKEDGVEGEYGEFFTTNGHVLQVKLFYSAFIPDHTVVRLAHDGGQDAKESKEPLKNDSDVLWDFFKMYCEDFGLGDLTADEGEDIDDHYLNEEAAGETVAEATQITCASFRSGRRSFVARPICASYDINNNSIYNELLKACTECYHNLQYIHWNAKGDKFTTIHSLAESLYDEVSEHADLIAEWGMEFSGNINNALSLEYSNVESIDGFDYINGLSAIREELSKYLAVLEGAYSSLDHDVQSVVDEWIRNLKKQNNYIITRMQMM